MRGKRYRMDGPQPDRYPPCTYEPPHQEWECPDCSGAGEWYDEDDIEHHCEMCDGTGVVDDPDQPSMKPE